MNHSAERIATAVNSVIVMFAPAVAMLTFSGASNSVTVHAPGASPFINATRSALMYAAVVSPFAVAAGWRTWVHAQQRRERRTSGLQGIAEAGVLGFSIVFVPIALAVSSHLAERPWLTIGYALFYAGIGLAVGVVVGSVLWVIATGVLALWGRVPTSST